VQITRRVAARVELRLVHAGVPASDHTQTLFLLGRDGIDTTYGLVVAL
jgi:hypothetical protein